MTSWSAATASETSSGAQTQEELGGDLIDVAEEVSD